jgi:type I restriction enzyme R subunit
MKKDPKYVALQVVIDKMNDLFGAESFAESQTREFVQGLSSDCSQTRT